MRPAAPCSAHPVVAGTAPRSSPRETETSTTSANSRCFPVHAQGRCCLRTSIMTSDSASVTPAADRARSSSCFAPGARRWRRRGKTAASTDTPEPTLMTLIGPSPKRELQASNLHLNSSNRSSRSRFRATEPRPSIAQQFDRRRRSRPPSFAIQARLYSAAPAPARSRQR
jgi:hypothetical protein